MVYVFEQYNYHRLCFFVAYIYIICSGSFCPTAFIGMAQTASFDDRDYFIKNGLIEKILLFTGKYINGLV